MQCHCSAKPITQAVRCHAVTCTLAVVVLVNSLTLRRYQPTDPGYSFGASFHYRLIRESLIFATFSAAGMGVGLYAGRLIRIYTVTLPTCLRCKQPTSWPLVRSIEAIHLTITLQCSGDTSSTPTCKHRLWVTTVHNARTSCHWQHCIATSPLLMQHRLLSTRNIGR